MPHVRIGPVRRTEDRVWVWIVGQLLWMDAAVLRRGRHRRQIAVHNVLQMQILRWLLLLLKLKLHSAGHHLRIESGRGHDRVLYLLVSATATEVSTGRRAYDCVSNHRGLVVRYLHGLQLVGVGQRL